MTIKKAIIVYKKSSYQKQVLESTSRYYRKLVRKSNISVRHWVRLHEEHMAVLKQVQDCLKRYDIPFKAYHRFTIRKPIRADLVITVGGDGTFLETAHSVHRQLMFGVNSTPGSSIGHFSAASGHNFETKLKALLQGRSREKILQRLQIYRNRRKLGPPILNEVLFTSQNAGATSRYWMRINTDKQKGALEEQKSSGIWVATPAGSTAAIHSAGGMRLPMEARKFSYRVRELYRQKGTRHVYRSGILKPDQSLQIIPNMEDGTLFIDGPHIIYPVRRGETLSIKLSAEPLRIVA